MDNPREVSELERFGDVREGPQRSGLLRESGVCPCRHDDDRERGTQSEDSLEDLHAIHSRHHEIEEHEIRRIMLDQRQGIPAVLSEFHAIASGREILLHDANDRVVIVDDEDTGRLARHSYSYVTSRL